MDYLGEITRIQVMHHNLTHETIPFPSTATTGSASLTLTRLP